MTLARLDDKGQPFFVFIVADGCFNDVVAALQIIDIYRNEAFSGKVIGRIGAAVVKR